MSIRVVPTHRLESGKAGSTRRTEARDVGAGCRLWLSFHQHPIDRHTSHLFGASLTNGTIAVGSFHLVHEWLCRCCVSLLRGPCCCVRLLRGGLDTGGVSARCFCWMVLIGSLQIQLEERSLEDRSDLRLLRSPFTPAGLKEETEPPELR